MEEGIIVAFLMDYVGCNVLFTFLVHKLSFWLRYMDYKNAQFLWIQEVCILNLADAKLSIFYW